MSTTDPGRTDKPRRPRGRPRAADPRRKRAVLWTDAEWAEVRRRAAEAGLRVGEYVRRAALGDAPGDKQSAGHRSGLGVELDGLIVHELPETPFTRRATGQLRLL